MAALQHGQTQIGLESGEAGGGDGARSKVELGKAVGVARHLRSAPPRQWRPRAGDGQTILQPHHLHSTPPQRGKPQSAAGSGRTQGDARAGSECQRPWSRLGQSRQGGPCRGTDLCRQVMEALLVEAKELRLMVEHTVRGRASASGGRAAQAHAQRGGTAGRGGQARCQQRPQGRHAESGVPEPASSRPVTSGLVPLTVGRGTGPVATAEESGGTRPYLGWGHCAAAAGGALDRGGAVSSRERVEGKTQQGVQGETEQQEAGKGTL